MPNDLQSAGQAIAGDPRVLAVWGFGSQARGEAGAASDLDLAVLLDREISLADELRLRSRVTEALRRDDVDLVVLNSAPPLLRYEVVAAGRRLFARDEEAADRFEERAMRECFDTAYLRQVQRDLSRRSREVRA